MPENDFKRLHNDRKTRRENDPDKARRRRRARFISLNDGPVRDDAAVAEDVSYCGSGKTFDHACRIKADLDTRPLAGTVVLIYRFVQIQPQLVLVRTDVLDSGVQPRGEVLAYRVFRVSENLAKSEKRGELADKIEELLKTFGQTGDATGAQPR
jgi:hypothetical protein